MCDSRAPFGGQARGPQVGFGGRTDGNKSPINGLKRAQTLVNLLAFTSVYFSEMNLLNGLQPIQIRKTVVCHTVSQMSQPRARPLLSGSRKPRGAGSWPRQEG